MKKVVQIKKIAEELLNRLGIQTKIDIKEDNEGKINLQLEAAEPGILIGYHGETLAAIQLIISLIAFKKIGEWTRILVNVGDYWEKRQESLERMASSVAQKVKFSGQAQFLPPMSASERRIIHLALSNDLSVETVSEGMGRERHIVIKPRL